ncbi:hypothetical protein [Streptomyces sp. NPDC003996]
MLRWFREHGCVHCLARDAGISQATGYRYLHEGIGVLAAQAPDLHEVLDLCRAEGMTHMVLDGTLIACDRLAGGGETGNDLWFSQKHKSFGGNIQFLAAPDGTPRSSASPPLPSSRPTRSDSSDRSPRPCAPHAHEAQQDRGTDVP